MQYSIVEKNNLDEIVFRLDAEYYHPDQIELQKFQYQDVVKVV